MDAPLGSENRRNFTCDCACDDPEVCSAGCGPANCATNVPLWRTARLGSGDVGLGCDTCAATPGTMNPKRIILTIPPAFMSCAISLFRYHAIE